VPIARGAGSSIGWIGRAAPAAAVLGLVAAGLALAGCGAPESQPATGAVAEDVEAALRSGTETFDHTPWDELLRAGTADGLVDYRFFQQRRPDLDTYLARVAEADLARLAPNDLKALLINAYNALTVRAILDRPEVSSIREIDGVWTEAVHRVGGHRLSLDNIEHNLLRPYYRDPRIHFAVNCASMSCAPLPGWAFTGGGMEEQLDERTTTFLRAAANVLVEDGGLRVSRYFDWYGDDFVAEGWEPRASTIPEFIGRFSRPEVADLVTAAEGDLEVRFLDYDWSLNAAVRPDPAVRPEGGADGGGAAGQAAAEDSESTGGWVAALRDRVAGFGAAAPAVYGLVYIIAVVLLIPGSALTIGAGVAFGLGLGTIVVVLSANTGAALAFLIARYLMRSRVERWLAGRDKLGAVDRAVEQQGWKVVALTRLSPVFPFNVQNYFYGLTAVGFWAYVLTSIVAMLPGTLLYVYIGVAGTGVAAALTGAASWGRTGLQVTGLAATLLVVWLVTSAARRELQRATDAVG
jgi:uncharacterized membrane protein YdjX (TVP38/TMEM64 family)